MKEDDEIRRKCGTENPFTVPEGYFEDFTKQLMAQLPEQAIPTPLETKVTTWHRVKPWLYMAAMFCGLMFGFKYMTRSSESTNTAILSDNETKSPYSDEYIEAVIDNSMMDDYTIYCYLTEAENNSY